jgi:hypothetical protein
MPALVRDLHSRGECLGTAGRAEITAAANPAAWVLLRFALRCYASTMAVGTGSALAC